LHGHPGLPRSIPFTPDFSTHPPLGGAQCGERKVHLSFINSHCTTSDIEGKGMDAQGKIPRVQWDEGNIEDKKGGGRCCGGVRKCGRLGVKIKHSEKRKRKKMKRGKKFEPKV